MGDLRKLPETRGKAVLLQTLQWREAEGRRKMVRSTDWKYTYDPDDPIDELYDLNSDPGEEVNLAADKLYGHIVSEMRSRLLEWSVRTEGGTRPTPLPEDPHYQPEKRDTQHGSR